MHSLRIVRAMAVMMLVVAGNAAAQTGEPVDWPAYPANPFVISLEHPFPAHSDEGGIFAHDCDSDGLLDYVVTSPGRVSVYAHAGSLLWSAENSIQVKAGGDFPGLHHPGAAAGDINNDGLQEILWMTTEGKLEIRNAANGEVIASHDFPGAKVALIANLRGQGDCDAVLQYGQGELRAIRLDTAQTLWHSQEWLGSEHGPARIADIDGDGRDEIAGPILLDDDGQVMHTWNLKRDRGTAMSSFDSVVIADVVPGGPLEIALAEQGGNNEAILVNPDAILWGKFNQPPPIGECAREIDPDKLAVGDFDPARQGLEIFCRSACGCAPWVFDARGQLIASWLVSDHAPDGWFLGGPDGPEGSEGGLEEIVAIDWNGDGAQHIVAKERHIEGDAAVIQPMTGEFVKVFPSRAARIYAADVSGDRREEVILLEGAQDGNNGVIRIFANDAPTPPAGERHWTSQLYRRQKQNWNYYSP